MALTDKELTILRQMLCSSQGMQNGQQIQLTPDGLATLRAKSDEEVRAMILLWTNSKVAVLNKQLQAVQDQIAVLSVTAQPVSTP